MTPTLRERPPTAVAPALREAAKEAGEAASEFQFHYGPVRDEPRNQRLTRAIRDLEAALASEPEPPKVERVKLSFAFYSDPNHFDWLGWELWGERPIPAKTKAEELADLADTFIAAYNDKDRDYTLLRFLSDVKAELRRLGK